MVHQTLVGKMAVLYTRLQLDKISIKILYKTIHMLGIITEHIFFVVIKKNNNNINLLSGLYKFGKLIKKLKEKYC